MCLFKFKEYEECQLCFQILISSKLLNTKKSLFTPQINHPFLFCRVLDVEDIPGKIREAGLSDGEAGFGISYSSCYSYLII